ncbi:small GTP-binding protein [Hamiltosporidium tvaerminnensis]|uniref:Small GTP-binding protein n=1 Tax=Hamiltosporidium tvaerminnensis TaxID=1176355 RepID=A0A4Q9L3Q6_9MICR|nr:ADP-ribosylation factor-like protein 2 [Hamiltosporidium tvaerminnensis]TBU02153.1 small GTP-binding protein [Hamiltosporidium tvaerminnensis]TBU12447.1 small GTP-binding protein [Hamiltosporidium tvaerminnensis]
MTIQRLINKIIKNNKNIKVLIIGLDNCGKTSLLYKMFGKSICDVVPTFGYSLFSVEYFFRRKLFTDQLDVERFKNSVCCNKEGDMEGMGVERMGVEEMGVEDISKREMGMEDISKRGMGMEGEIKNMNLKKNIQETIQDCREQEIYQSIEENLVQNLDCNDIYTLTIVDVGGQSLFRKYWSSYYEKVDGVVFVYDLSDNRKYEELLEEIVNDVELENVPIVVMGNKCDLVGFKEEESRYDKYGDVRFIYTSALTGKNVRNGFEWLLSKIIANK